MLLLICFLREMTKQKSLLQDRGDFFPFQLHYLKKFSLSCSSSLILFSCFSRGRKLLEATPRFKHSDLGSGSSFGKADADQDRQEHPLWSIALTLSGMAESPQVLPLEESLTSELQANSSHAPHRVRERGPATL